MNSQLSLFEVNPVVSVADIRTEQQSSKKFAYDVGEKIGNSRKDIAALRKAFEENQSATLLSEIEEFSTILAAEIINKNELFKSFTLEKEKEKGTEPSAARAKQLLIQRVDHKPKVDSKESRQQFMKAAQYLLAMLEPVKTMFEFYRVLSDIGTLLRNERNQSIKETNHAKEIGLSILGDKFCNFFRKESSFKSTLTNALKINSWDELLSKKEKKRGSRMPVWERTLPERPDRIGGAQSPIKKPEDLVTFFGFRGVEFGHYVEDSKAAEHLLRSSEAMMDLAELLGMDYKAISLNGTLAIAYGARGRGKALAHYEPISKVINLTKEKGCLGVFAHEWFHALDNYIYNLSNQFTNGKRGYASEPDTLGIHIDSYLPILFSELMDEIKKGSSIGYIENTNTPEVKWRGTSFKTAYKRSNGDLYEAMKEKMILEQIYLEDEIRFYSGLTNGEKKIEKAKKNYERNIKKFAQALAWFHEQETGERVERIPYPSDKSQYFQNAIILDKQKEGKYWSSNVELAARAFEAFIQDKLKASNRVSDYLVAGTNDKTAFPMGEERKAINEKFEVIMKYIKDLQLI
ncbi:LPD1 domain-containing protein [Neobacillus sp.]|uniref:LPD1 domain-containing protein n=1 Tax=Neobacillus sp. TaxID=2675273 RepID=UPI0035B5128F